MAVYLTSAIERLHVESGAVAAGRPVVVGVLGGELAGVQRGSNDSVGEQADPIGPITSAFHE